MRTVIYTDDMEPITVIDLPYQAYTIYKPYWRVPIMEDISIENFSLAESAIPATFKFVDICRETFIRKGKKHPFFFSNDEEFALLMEPCALPGQIKYIRDENKRKYIQGFLAGVCAVIGE